MGRSVYGFAVGENPAFSQPRAVQHTFEGTSSGGGYCVNDTMNLYGADPVTTVGDPIEFAVVHASCDSTQSISSMTIHDAIKPPKGCPSANWPRSGVYAGGGVYGALPSFWATRYGPPNGFPQLPPGFTPPVSSGIPDFARVFVNCAGTWVITMRTWVNTGGTSTFAGRAKVLLNDAPALQTSTHEGDQMYGVVVVTGTNPRRCRMGRLSSEASTCR